MDFNVSPVDVFVETLQLTCVSSSFVVGLSR